MLKVVYLPLNTPDGKQEGTINSWKDLGVDLTVFDFYMDFLNNGKNVNIIRKNFIFLIDSKKPDLVHMQLQFTGVIDRDTLIEAKKRSPNTIFVNWSGDIRKNVPQEFLSVANAVDYALVSNVGQIDLYKNAGCKNCHYWQIGFDPNYFYPLNKDNFSYDIVFTANAYGMNEFPDVGLRLEISRALKKKYKNSFGLFGNGYGKDMGARSPTSGRATNEIYNSSRTVLSISNFNDVSHYFSDRLLACLASGRPTICYRFPGSESYFADKNDLFIVRSVSEIIDVVEFCRNNPEEANKVGRNGSMKVLAEHTFTSRLLELVSMIGLMEKLYD